MKQRPRFLTCLLATLFKNSVYKNNRKLYQGKVGDVIYALSIDKRLVDISVEKFGNIAVEGALTPIMHKVIITQDPYIKNRGYGDRFVVRGILRREGENLVSREIKIDVPLTSAFNDVSYDEVSRYEYGMYSLHKGNIAKELIRILSRASKEIGRKTKDIDLVERWNKRFFIGQYKFVTKIYKKIIYKLIYKT